MKQKKWLIIIAIAFIIMLIIAIIFLTSNTKDVSTELEKMGYTTNNEEEAFYKKIVTNNTLNDYYNDLANQVNSQYEEYYFAKESYDYIELKMSYQNGTTKTLTITSNLKNLETKYNYEISKDKSYVLLESNKDSNFECNPITTRNITDEEVERFCQEARNETSSFLIKRDEVLNNKQIKAIINK